jgi:hypothetical protein
LHRTCNLWAGTEYSFEYMSIEHIEWMQVSGPQNLNTWNSILISNISYRLLILSSFTCLAISPGTYCVPLQISLDVCHHSFQNPALNTKIHNLMFLVLSVITLALLWFIFLSYDLELKVMMLAITHRSVKKKDFSCL